MRNIFIALAFTVVFIGVNTASRAADDKKPSTAQIEMLDIETLEKMRKAVEPTEQLRILSNLNGKWNYVLSFYSKKGGDPQRSSGSIDNDMILGGRFLSGKTNLVLNIGGENILYEGFNIIGYDNIKKLYTLILIDTLHAGVTEGEGKFDEKEMTLVFKGRMNHPLFEKERTYRAEIKFIDDDKYTQTVFIADKAGSEFKLLEIEFSRSL